MNFWWVGNGIKNIWDDKIIIIHQIETYLFPTGGNLSLYVIILYIQMAQNKGQVHMGSGSVDKDFFEKYFWVLLKL